MARKRQPSIGSVSHGTMREEDLIPAFLDELEYYAPSKARKIRKEYDYDADEFEFDSEDAGYMLEELFDALDAISPRFCSFGAHPGDGSDYGWWANLDYLDEDYLPWSDDTRNPSKSELAQYAGFFSVNDHGNATIFARNYKVIAAYV